MSTALQASSPAARTRERIARANVVVLLGGTSSEREVSLHSGAAVASALGTPADAGDRRGPAVVTRIEIDADGSWCLGSERVEAGVAIARLGPDTLYFLALHGGQGENGTLQGLLASHDRLHTGSGVEASALCMNKHATRLVLQAAGLTVAPARLVTRARWDGARSAELLAIADFGASGVSVKPNRGGSSVSTYLVERASDVPNAVERVLATGDSALVEAWVRGTEATCAVLGNASSALRALPPVEIVPRGDRFFDYEQKYSENGADEYCPPRGLSAATCARLEALSLAAHDAAGCDGYSRTDFIVPRDARGTGFIIPRDARGTELEPVVLEINTLPGMTARSLLPRSAAAAGFSLRELCLEILALALERRGDVP
jgi:D-alanine-D-alanine ligase